VAARSLLALVLIVAACGGSDEAAVETGPPTRPPGFYVEPPAEGQQVTPDEALAIYDQYVDEVGIVGERRGLRQMNEGQKAVYALGTADGEIQNGGFAQFFFSSGGLADDALEGARLLGARPYERLLADAIALFPNGIPQQQATRRAALNRIPPDKLSRLDERWYAQQRPVTEYLAAYINAHPDAFFLDR